MARCFNEQKIEEMQSRLPGTDVLEQRVERLKAVAHPGRLAVLHLLALAECCVCDVSFTLDLPVSTASQHLRRLERAGLATSRQQGKWVYYSLTEAGRVSDALAFPEPEEVVA